MDNHFEYVAEKLQEIEDWASEHADSPWNSLYLEIDERLDELMAYADENGVPLKVDAYSLTEKHYRDEGQDDYEESSSYYEEEESSSYYEEDEDSSWS